MTKPLPISEFEQKLFPDYSQEQVEEYLSEIPDDNEYGFFIECELEYLAQPKKPKTFHLVLIKQKQILIISQIK